jgi:cardiolipin synthase A/B
MRLFSWAFEHHVLSVLLDLLVLWFAASVLRQRRPTGSALAWLLALILIPYLGIPAYLMFGGRKFKQKARSKTALSMPSESPQSAAAAAWALGRVECASSIEWLDDGVRAYETFLGQIRGAKRSIRITTYLIGNDPTGNSLVDAMSERARAGVEVTLLLDDLLAYKSPHEAINQLKTAGGKVERFMPLMHIPFRGQANLRNHRKIALFDGERAIVGGMNLADEYMGPKPRADRWRDLSILISGQAVVTLDTIFRADWEFASKQTLAPAGATAPTGPIPIRVVPSGPDSSSDPIYDAMLTMVFRAQKRFCVATPYFVPDEPLSRALEVAARRGVEVIVVVPNQSNHRVADFVGGTYLRDLADAGVQIRRTPKMLHAKAVFADDSVAAVGSANFDMRSLFLDYEIAVFLTGPAEIARMAAWFDETIKNCAVGPSPAGPIRRAAESAGRLLAPLI